MNTHKSETSDTAKEKIPPLAYVYCCWPMVLIAIGGAVGGALGGAASAVNLSIYKSTLGLGIKIALNILTGAAAFVLWMVVGALFFKVTNT